MKKYFNDTGSCFPEEHYMVDISNKTTEIFGMIEQGHYFVINRPRQYGKTTTIHTINNNLENSETYLPIEISFEGIGDAAFKNESLSYYPAFFPA